MSAQPTIANPGVLTCQDLLRATGFERVGDLRRCLERQNVRFFLGRDGAVWTTIDLLNAAGGLLPRGSANQADDVPSIRELFP